MPGFAKTTKTTIIPVLRYRDAPAAIEWLCLTFGFEKPRWRRTTMARLPTRNSVLATA